ncbi:DNA recombination protein RmuC [Methylophaga sp.]|uniref:DNA recombination protein RmuC n=1 Tax=Methylophaga sp. TaxID=2024840 RepID=UPI003A936E93
MLNSASIFLVSISALLAGGLGYLLARLQLGKKLTSAEFSNEALQKELNDYEQLKSEHNVLKVDKHKLEIENSTLQNNVENQMERVQKAETQLDSEQKQHRQLQQENNQTLQGNRAFKTELAETEKSANLLKTQIAELKQEQRQTQEKLDIEKENHAQTRNTLSELRTSLEEREKGFAKQVEQFEEQKNALKEQFKLLANEILEEKSKSLNETNKLSLNTVMNPFQESLKEFKKEVQDIHHRETTQQGELKKELDHLKELNKNISEEAHQLTTALRGQKKLQGNWGELVLENVLDRSGLELGKDYKREVSITTEDGKQRPDAIVYLPQNKHLIIDAKVSLEAYTQYVNAEDEVTRAQALKAHIKAVSDRITELADRNYYKLPGLNSPEMVFLFMPIESAFVEAIKADETLFQKAIENNVLVATPTTLLTSLNIVRQLWRYEDQNKHTAALADKAEKVFSKLNSFLGSFESIKKALDRASDAYINAEKQLVSGRGNLVKQVGEFKNLAPAIKAELPSYFTEKADLEINYIPEEQQLSDNDMLINNKQTQEETA